MKVTKKLKKYYIKALIDKGMLLKLTGDLNNSIECCKKANIETDNTQLKIKSNIVLAGIYISTDIQKAENTCMFILNDLNIHKDKMSHAITLTILGVVYWYKGDVDKALEMYEKAYMIGYRMKSYQKHIASNINNIGTVYHMRGEFEKALSYYNRSIKKYIRYKQKDRICEILGNIATIYLDMQKWKKAEDVLFEWMRAANDIKYYPSLNECYIRTFLLYYETDRLDEALKYADLSLELAKRIENQRGLCLSYFYYGQIYSKMNKNKKAIKFYEKALGIGRTIDYRHGIGMILVELANTKLIIKKFENILEDLSECETIFNELNDISHIVLVYIGYARFYSHNKDHKKADRYFRKAIELSDSSESAVIKYSSRYAYSQMLVKIDKNKAIKILNEMLDITRKNKMKKYFKEAKDLYNSIQRSNRS